VDRVGDVLDLRLEPREERGPRVDVPHDEIGATWSRSEEQP
jgi:hypothetical protein